MTKFDILNGWQQDNFVKVCTKYDKEPVSGGDFFTTKPEYTFLPFWNDASDDEQIRPFIEFVEKETQLRVEYVSSGVGENDIRKWY
jgi:adenylosuccinate synthase